MWIPLIVALGSLAQEPGPLDVRVRVGRDGEAVSGAVVRWFEGAEADLDFGRVDERALASGNVATSDGEGCVVLPKGTLPITVVARAPGLWGRQVCYGEELRRYGVLEVELFEDRDLLVDVVDAQGVPLDGATVALWSSISSWWEFDGWYDYVRLRAPVIAGRASLKHANCALASSRIPREFLDYFGAADGDRLRVSQWYVALDTTPTCASTLIELDDAVPAQPLRIVASGLVDLEVLLLDDDGRPARGVERVYLTSNSSLPHDPGREGPHADVRAAVDDLPGASTASALHEGRALFHWVAPGRELRVVAFRNACSAPTRHDFTLPADASGLQRVAATLGEGTVSLRLRAMLDGHALAGQQVAVQRPTFCTLALDVSMDAAATASSMATDDDGVLRCDLWPGRYSANEPLRICTTLARGRRVEYWLPKYRSEPGAFDLGDVEFGDMTVLIAGTVVDDGGAPLIGARVAALRASCKHPLCDATTDADGRFELRGAFPGDVVVEVSGAALFSESFAFSTNTVVARGEASGRLQRGALDARIQLRRRADVRGYLRLAGGRATKGLTLYLQRVDEISDPDLAPGSSCFCACDGRFEFPGIKAGRYMLLVKERVGGGKPKLVFTRRDIQVAGGQTTDLGEIVIR